MAKKWVHHEFRFEVQQKYLELCQRFPQLAKRDNDSLFNQAKDIIEFAHRVNWVDFQHKHRLGVFSR